MKRRDFMSWFGLGLMATSLPIVIAACQPADESDSADAPDEEELPELDKTPREDGFTPVGYVSELDDKGFILGKSIGEAGVAVIRDPADAA
ncbi:MAG: cytochrome B6, partial [Cyanobacteria bacterium P01_H01_bin.130]